MITKRMVREAKRRFNEIRQAQPGEPEDIIDFNGINNIETAALYELLDSDVIRAVMAGEEDEEGNLLVAGAIGRITGFHIGVICGRLESAGRGRQGWPKK